MLTWIILLGFGHVVYADDPGITKVRLIQQTDTSYLLEADVPQVLLNTIKKPVLPDRFEMTDFDFTNQAGWITLKMTLSTSGASLSPEDEILLPWLRNGIDFTAQWLDGSTYKGLFNRGLNGIHIPLREVMPTSKTTIEVLKESFMMGTKHIRFHYIHILLILMLVFSRKDFSVFKLVLWFSFGQAAALIAAEIGWSGIDLLYSELLILVMAGIYSYTLSYNRSFKYEGIALFITGLVHGISFVHEIRDLSLEPIQRLQALFAFNLAIDLAHFLLAILILLLMKAFSRILPEDWKILSDGKKMQPDEKKMLPDRKKMLPEERILPYGKKLADGRKMQPDRRKIGIATGAVSIFMILVVFQGTISIGSFRILDYGSTKSSTTISIPVSGNLSGRQVQRGIGIMTTPFMLFLSVEPYEVRQEVLMRAEEVMREFNPGYASDQIPVALQEELKSYIGQKVFENAEVKINGKEYEVGDMNVNFVHLSRGGVSIREKPVEENVPEGIIGITIIYDTETLPDSVDVKWRIFTDSVQMVEASVVDAHGAFTKVLTPDDMDIQWKNRLAGYRVPVIEAITVEPYPLPLLSMVIFISIIVVIVVMLFKSRQLRHLRGIAGFLIIAFVMYPFVRTSAAVPFITNWLPSNEQTGLLLNDLLTNVYRAFDRRNEDAVYDRLALSVTGGQLTEIYLQNRQVMALENRGGARAKVDEVDILEVFEVDRSEDGGIKADVMWAVRGSVNHFGHTHYRQNQYRALVSFVDEEGIWKINSIEPIEEIRIY